MEVGWTPANDVAPRAGLLAARGPAADHAGEDYWATDDNGGARYFSDGVVWHLIGPRGVILARKERTASSGAVGMEAAFTTETVLADLDAFTVTSRGKPYKVRLHIPLMTVSTTNNAAQARIRDITGLSNPTAGQGVPRAFTSIESVRAGGGGPVHIVANIDDAEGVQRTFRAVGTRAGAGTGSVTAHADNDTALGKAFIEAVEE